MRDTDPFKPFAGWQDVDSIKEDVERAFAKGARVKVDTLRAALRRVVADGWHGPFVDREWEVVDGRRMPMKRALAILQAAQSASLPQVLLSHPDHGYACEGAERCTSGDHEDLGEPGPLFHEEPIEIDHDALVKWYFGALVPIYGTAYV